MDKKCFANFYDSYLKRIYRFVYFRVGMDRALAEDVTQEIFLKAFEAFERYDPARGETAWLYTIARHHLINHHAKTHPGISLEDVEGTVWASEDARERMAVGYDERRLLEAINHLSEEDARLVRMKYLEGWSFEDLTEVFEKSSAALRVQAGRVLKKIRAQLKPYSL